MKTLSIVIPVFNEEKRLQKTFTALKKLRLSRGFHLNEVIFANDGSTDSTLEQIQKFSSHHKKLPIHIISYPQNKGKGYAVRTGMLDSNSDYTLLCDADMSTPFTEFAKFETHIQNGIDVVIGTRKNGHSTVIVHQPKIRELLGKGFTYTTRVILRLDITDFTCGFKLFDRQSIREIFPYSVINRWGYDAEILYIAKSHNLKIAECPVKWSDDKGSHVNVFEAIPQTIIEMGKILTTHTVLPHIRISLSQIGAFFV